MSLEINCYICNYYSSNYDIEFKSNTLDNAHWYAYDWSYDEIILCHDTDPDVVKFAATLGDSLFVWIEGDRTECPLEVRDGAVYITLEVNYEDDALHNGPYDTDTNLEVH